MEPTQIILALFAGYGLAQLTKVGIQAFSKNDQAEAEQMYQAEKAKLDEELKGIKQEYYADQMALLKKARKDLEKIHLAPSILNQLDDFITKAEKKPRLLDDGALVMYTAFMNPLMGLVQELARLTSSELQEIRKDMESINSDNPSKN